MNVSGKNVMVFAKDYGQRTGYSVGVSSRKYENGRKTDEHINAYIFADFANRDKVPPKDKEKIDIKKAFLAAYETRDGKTGIKLIVTEWDTPDGGYNGGGYDWGDA